MQESEQLQIDRVLIMKPKWGILILDGNKSWEIRRTDCKFRGRFGIAYSGTSAIFGTVELVDSFPLTKELFETQFNKHFINCRFEDLPSSYKYVWVLKDAHRLQKPIAFKRKRGALIWQLLK